MNFRKLITYLTMGTAAAMPLAVAQNPTILQGSYISNVFGNSNFVLNPNAQTNVANVTNATRSTTTPLVATSEFTLSLASGANATWTLRAFDGGMKGQNCEARFTYRGFATATTKAEIVQNSLVVASLTLTPTTDPRIASINFPCGDLVNATTFRIAQTTANMTGTNEIGGIYVGLATNMANVAQAEMIGTLRNYGANCIWSGNGTSAIAVDTDCATYSKEGLDLQPTTRVPAIAFTAPRSGNYAISAHIYTGAATLQVVQCQVYQNGVLKHNISAIYTSAGGTSNENRAYAQFNADLTGGTAYTFDLRCTSGMQVISRSVEESLYWTVYRFPSSSELVVTPERQNVFGGVRYTNSNQSIRGGLASSSTYGEFNSAAWNQPTSLIGKAAVTTTGSGNDLGFSIPNLPVGQYKISIRGLINANTFTATTLGQAVNCSFKIRETTIGGTGVDVALQASRDVVIGTGPSASRDWTNSFFGVFNNTSVATRNFRLEAAKTVDGTTGNVGNCQAYASASGELTDIVFLIEPLDQPSNSALYVEGPVKASATGAAISAGYVGEKIEVIGTAAATINTTSFATSATLASYTFPVGVYIVIPSLACKELTSTTGGPFRIGAVVTTSSTGTFTLTSTATAGTVSTSIPAGDIVATYGGVPLFLNITSPTLYYLRSTIWNNTTTGSVECKGSLSAVRFN